MNSVRIIPGDCRQRLAALPDNSVHCVITSPPYFGLRDYQVVPGIWGGELKCKHLWNDSALRSVGNSPSRKSTLSTNNGRGPLPGDKYQADTLSVVSQGSVCHKCGAWRGSFGLEPTIGLYLEHAVEIFREVRRVLRKDGVMFLNMGDSYVSAPPGNKGKFNPETDKDGAYSRRGNRQLGHGEDMEAIYAKGKWREGQARADGSGPRNDGQTRRNRNGVTSVGNSHGLKQKDLIGMPWRLALALQSDGWWLRQDIIWARPNPMPESTTDRCTKSHEYLFLLTKSAKYFYDQEAIAEPVASSSIVRISEDSFNDQTGGDKDYSAEGQNGNSIRKALKNFSRLKPAVGTNTLFGEDGSLPPSRSGNKARKAASERGVPVDTDGATSGAVAGSVPWSGWTRNKRSVWTIPAQPFPGKHFAVFPEALVRPCLLAGCPEDGVALDPFGGSGTVGLVASQLGRSAILIELNEKYVQMAYDRISGALGLSRFQCPVTIESPRIERPRRKDYAKRSQATDTDTRRRLPRRTAQP